MKKPIRLRKPIMVEGKIIAKGAKILVEAEDIEDIGTPMNPSDNIEDDVDVAKAKRLAKILNVDYRTLSQKGKIMYSTKTATTNNSEFNSSYIPVGINENIVLKEVNVNKSTNGKDFLEIIFENENGQTATMTEWKNEKNMWIKTDEDLQKRDNQQFGRILQVIDAAMGSHTDFEGSSFLEMINWVKQQLEPATNTANMRAAMRLKVTYDKNGFTQVSKNGIFVEPMGAEESQIKLWKNDLLERPIVADKEPTTDPLDPTITPVTETTSTGADDLPF